MASINSNVGTYVQNKRMKRVEKHPVSKAWISMRNNVLVYVSRRGVNVRTGPNRCLPMDVGMCGKCMWAEAGAACRTCSLSESLSIAWQVQCKSCLAPSRRRRLLGAEIVNYVEVVLGNATEASLSELFPAAEVRASALGVSVRIIDSDHPDTDIRAMRAAIAEHPEWVVVTQPVVVYPEQSSANTQVLGTPALVIVGGVCGIIVLGGIAYTILKCYKHYNPPMQSAFTFPVIDYVVLRNW
jgi:hypothetical protein